MTASLLQVPRLTEADYRFIVQLVYERSRISLGDEKRELVTARLGKRLRHHGLPTIAAYCELLRTPAGNDELTHLIDVISTNHTFFFREIRHFEFIERELLPAYLKQRTGKAFRVWSAACSTGEEPYSLAVQFAEFARTNPGFSWTLDATDISTRVLAKAREGVFARDRIREIRPDLLARYFRPAPNTTDGEMQVKPELRHLVKFHHVNLFQANLPFHEPFHLILCRNVMIYFDRPTQEQLVDRLHRNLVPGGHLLVGHSESLTGVKHAFRMERPAIYMKAA